MIDFRELSITTQDDWIRRKRLIRMKFKKLVRLTIQHRHWLKDNEGILDYFSRLEHLTFRTRVALCQKPENRTGEDLTCISLLLSQINDFKRFESVIDQLTRYVEYQVVYPNTVILREGHPASSLHAIIAGDVEVIVSQSVNTLMASDPCIKLTLPVGSLFGDFALLYDKPRTTTIKAISITELIIIPKNIFDMYIKKSLLEHYNLMKRYISNFRYFDEFSESHLNEACFYGRVQKYTAGKILYNFQDEHEVTFLVVEGSCDLIETIRVNRATNGDGGDMFTQLDSHDLYIPTRKSTLSILDRKNTESLYTTKKYKPFQVKAWYSQSEQKSVSNSLHLSNKQGAIVDSNVCSTHDKKLPSMQDMRKQDHISVLTQMSFKKDLGNVLISKQNIALATRLRIRKAMRTNSKQVQHEFTIDKQFTPYETHYMKIATYSQNACFNIGELLKNRTIVANESLTVLEIPKKVLAKQRYVIWDQLRIFLDRYIPNNTHVFSKFIKDRMYRKWKDNLLASLKVETKVSSFNNIHNIPYSIRIRNDYDYMDKMHKV